MEELTTVTESAVIVALTLPGMAPSTVNDHLDELAELLKTAGADVKARVVQRRDRPDSATFIGRGKAAEIARIAEMNDVKSIVFDDDLSPAQVKNLEEITSAKILDRSMVIMDIFASRAKTREARTQVELAQYRYLLPRLTRRWTHLSRQVGGIGVRGVGETQLETDQRIIRRRITALERELSGIEKSRRIQRGRRGSLPSLALVGYTNAGKSTLFNRLTHGGQPVEDRLFATLDTRVARFQAGDDLPALAADTVGFIRKLPHHLVASFRSTMEEALACDLVLLVLDLSHPAMEEHRAVALEILESLEVDPATILPVYNKLDLLGGEPPPPDAYPAVSARSGEGIDDLRVAICARLLRDFVEVTYSFDRCDTDAIQQCMRRGTVLAVTQEEERTDVTIRQRRGKP